VLLSFFVLFLLSLVSPSISHMTQTVREWARVCARIHTPVTTEIRPSPWAPPCGLLTLCGSVLVSWRTVGRVWSIKSYWRITKDEIQGKRTYLL
jgi:hypothetical protein